jgi:hypothetical protein
VLRDLQGYGRRQSDRIGRHCRDRLGGWRRLCGLRRRLAWWHHRAVWFGRRRNDVLNNRRCRRGRRRRFGLEHQRNICRTWNVGEDHPGRHKQRECQQARGVCQQRQRRRRGRCGCLAITREPRPFGCDREAARWRARARVWQPGQPVDAPGIGCVAVPQRCPRGTHCDATVNIVAERVAHRPIPSRPRR